MENTQGVWILYVTVLALNFLIAAEQAVTAEWHWIMETAKLNQPIYFQMS